MLCREAPPERQFLQIENTIIRIRYKKEKREMNLFTVMILQAIAAVAWIIMAVRVHNVMSIVLAAIFTLMALSSAVKIFFGGGEK